MLIHPNEAASVHHLRRLQPGAAVVTDDLPKGKVCEARHRGLQDRRIDNNRPDLQRLDLEPRGGRIRGSRGAHACILFRIGNLRQAACQQTRHG